MDRERKTLAPADASEGNQTCLVEYMDRHFNMPAVKIGPGEFYTTKRDIIIVTVLGSCVSACLRDPETKVGGMNHFMLPYLVNDSEGLMSTSARYGAYAMEVLVNHLLSLGAKRERLEAKIFGAGRIVVGMSDIGERNAQFALEYLKREKIPVLAQNLGGEQASKVYFFPYTGKVMVKRLRSVRKDAILEQERTYAKRLDSLKDKVKPADLFI